MGCFSFSLRFLIQWNDDLFEVCEGKIDRFSLGEYWALSEWLRNPLWAGQIDQMDLGVYFSERREILASNVERKNAMRSAWGLIEIRRIDFPHKVAHHMIV